MASCAGLATLVTACGGELAHGAKRRRGRRRHGLGPHYAAGPFANSRVRVTTTATPLANVGGAARVESAAGLFLITRISDVAFTVVDGTCTHESCPIGGATDTQYVCQCHGSRYSRNGTVQQGPARANLRQFANSFADGVITITV